MIYLIILSSAVAGFLVSFFIQRLVLKLANKISLVGRNEKRILLDKSPRLRLGGIGIFSGFVASSFIYMSFYTHYFGGIFSKIELRSMNFVFVAMICIFITGLLDDLIGLNAWQKLPFEIAAATILFFNGFVIDLVSLPFTSGGVVLPGFLSYILTILWFVGITNAMNLIDGIDGLAGGIAFLSTSTFVVMSLLNNKPCFAVFSVGMLGAILAFLIYNVYPAKIYMGDSGSLILGFFLAAIALKSSTKASFGISFLFPIMVLFLPIFDTSLAVIRRILNKKSPFKADNEHIHHKLLRKGFEEEKVFFILMICMAVFSLLGILSMYMSKFLRILLFLFILIVGITVLFYLRYIGLEFIKKMLKKNDN